MMLFDRMLCDTAAPSTASWSDNDAVSLLPAFAALSPGREGLG
jgi:hypothetical protein